VAPAWLRRALDKSTNRPPVWSSAAEFERAERPVDRTVRGRPGHVVDFYLDATDPDGDELRYAAEQLPERAAFDTAIGHFVWTPGKDDVGSHRIAFHATDGRHPINLAVAIAVTADRAPSRSVNVGETIDVRAGGDYWTQLAVDHDGDVLSYVVSAAPPGTEFQVRGNELYFSVKEAAASSAEQRVTVTVTDGELSTVIDAPIFVVSRKSDPDWRPYFAPGLGYAGFTPLDGPGYHGVRGELTWAGRRNPLVDRRRCRAAPQDYRCDMSHWRLYSMLESGFPSSAHPGTLFAYAVGFTRGLEENPLRDFLVPYFGLEAGGLFSRSLPHLFQITPSLGLNVYTSAPLWIDLGLGLRVVPQRIESLSGAHFTLTATLGP
jgi:hypothetical protein